MHVFINMFLCFNVEQHFLENTNHLATVLCIKIQLWIEAYAIFLFFIFFCPSFLFFSILFLLQ